MLFFARPHMTKKNSVIHFMFKQNSFIKSKIVAFHSFIISAKILFVNLIKKTIEKKKLFIKCTYIFCQKIIVWIL